MRSNPIRLSLALALAAAASLPVQAQDGAPSDAEFQVVRRGDGDLSCDVLIAEINDLNGQVQAMQVRMTAMGSEMSRSSMAAMRRPGGGGLGLLGMAAGFVPGASLLTGAAAMAQQGAAQASARHQQERIMEQTASLSESVTAMAPMANRAAHLSEIARDKSC